MYTSDANDILRIHRMVWSTQKSHAILTENTMQKHVKPPSGSGNAGVLSAGVLAGEPHHITLTQREHSACKHYNNFDDSHIPPFLTPWSPAPEKSEKGYFTPARHRSVLRHSPAITCLNILQVWISARKSKKSGLPGILQQTPIRDGSTGTRGLTPPTLQSANSRTRSGRMTCCSPTCTAMPTTCIPISEERRKERQWCTWQMEAAERDRLPADFDPYRQHGSRRNRSAQGQLDMGMLETVG